MKSNVIKINEHEGQFNYLGRWVDKSTFRAFVYDREGNEKLADSYEEFESLTSSGIWYAQKTDMANIQPKVSKERKPKDDTSNSTSK
jgi:hypothetical protein